jgi:hypothetical protein
MAKKAKSITSTKRIIQVNENLLVVEYHTVYHKDDAGKDVNFNRSRAKFDEQVDKKQGWKKVKFARPLHTHKELPNDCVDWISTEIYTRR